MRLLQFFCLKFDPFRKEVSIEQLFASSSSIELRPAYTRYWPLRCGH